MTNHELIWVLCLFFAGGLCGDEGIFHHIKCIQTTASGTKLVDICYYMLYSILTLLKWYYKYVPCTVYANINVKAWSFESIVAVKELYFWRYYCEWNYISLSSYIKINLNFIFPIPIYYPFLTLIDSWFIAVDL